MATFIPQHIPQGADYWRNRSVDDDEHDWKDKAKNWILGYIKSVNHPHRKLIIDALKTMSFDSLLEVGCSAGPNLLKIKKAFPNAELHGVDINAESIAVAKKKVKGVMFSVGLIDKLPYEKKKFDVVLADAVLMYTRPEDIKKTLRELNSVTRNAMIIVDRYSPHDAIVGHVWGRNYPKLLEELGFQVETHKITEKEWKSSKNWIKYGRVFIARR